MPNKLRIFIIAGEVSGDALAARVMRQMPDAEFVGIGGSAMIAAGLKPVFPMADLAVMGIMEVLAHARTLSRRIADAVHAIIETKPDLVLTVDAPGFACTVIKKLRTCHAGREMIARGLRFHHVVAPQVWAWRPGRAKKYAKLFDKLYAFFDFEVPYFTKYGLDTMAVGHPIAENVLDMAPARTQSRTKTIALIPGSRMAEVKRLMPIFQTVAETVGCKNYKFAIPVVETTADYIKTAIANWKVRPELVDAANRYDLYRRTYVAVAASGTVSVELAMLHIPGIITYKMNRITTLIGRLLINVRWVSLINILLNKTVYPEFLGGAATADNILNALHKIALPAHRAKMVADLRAGDKLWVRNNCVPSKIIADDIRQSVKK